MVSSILSFTSFFVSLLKAIFNSVVASFANIYPNPVVDFASINVVDAQINAITVTDINGRIVKTIIEGEINNENSRFIAWTRNRFKL